MSPLTLAGMGRGSGGELAVFMRTHVKKGGDEGGRGHGRAHGTDTATEAAETSERQARQPQSPQAGRRQQAADGKYVPMVCLVFVQPATRNPQPLACLRVR